MAITLYDIYTLAGPTSPNTWKTRYCLNFKGLPYKTEWVEQPDIEALFIKLGIQPTGEKPDGRPYYTVPAIHDSTTGKYVADSWNIALYLDATYLDTPTLVSKDSAALQFAFAESYFDNVAPLVPFIMPSLYPLLPPRAAEVFLRNIERRFGKKLEEVTPKGDVAVTEWTKCRESLGKVDSWYSAAGTPFLLGDEPSWVDFVVAAFFMPARAIVGEDSQQWMDISTWHDGRWKRLVDSLRQYEAVH